MDQFCEALRQLREAQLLVTDLAIQNGHKLFLYDYADEREPTGTLESEVLNQKSQISMQTGASKSQAEYDNKNI